MFGNHPRQQCKEAINQGILFQNFGNAVIVSCYPTEEDNEPKDIKWPSGNQSADNQTKKTGGWWDGRQQTDNGQLGGRPRVLIADMLHLISFMILIQKIRGTRNCLGLSYKTQEIYLIVFLTRYWDLFLYYISLYNTTMKLLYISCTVYIIYLMRLKKPYCLSYDKESDSFPQYFLYLAAALLALIIHTEFGLFELSWSFSIWLEALAIIPQLYMLQKIKEVENLTSNYAAALGFYRFFYILSWIYRFYFDDWWCWTSVLGGLTQTVIYGDFLYYYILSRKMGSPMTLGV